MKKKSVLERISQISALLSKYIGLIIILLSVIAFFKPSGFAWATGYTSWFLGVAMFGMGLTIRMGDFGVVFTHPKEICIGCVAQYLVMPLVAWVLAVAFRLSPELALGVILVGCCPVARPVTSLPTSPAAMCPFPWG